MGSSGDTAREAAAVGAAGTGAAVCIGVSAYSDARLTSCPAAARTAEQLAGALEGTFSGGARAVTNPTATYELFLAIQAAARAARGGTFLLYFAGVTIRRGDELLLATRDTSLDAKSDCVAWSDVDAMLEHEGVARAIVLLNAEGFAGIGWGGPAAATTRAMGSVRIHDPHTADRRIAEYGAAVVDAFTLPAWELRDHLTDGRLDVAALDRHLAARAPAPPRSGPPPRGEAPRHETFGHPDPSDLVLRDLRADLAAGAPARAPTGVDAPAAREVLDGAATSPRSRAGLVLGIAAALVVVLVVALVLAGG